MASVPDEHEGPIPERSELLTLIQSHRNASMDLNEDPGRFWAELFRLYIIEGDHYGEDLREDDDLLWYVKQLSEDEVATTNFDDGEEAESLQKETFFVTRKTDPNLPVLADPAINWEETVYLNTIMHHFRYRLSIAICTKGSQQAKLQILSRVNKKVYASPSKRRMDSKSGETIFTYPLIYFAVDDFEESFKTLTIEQGQQICVQLSAFDTKTNKKCTLFQGGVMYDALRELFDWRKNSWSRIWKSDDLEFLPLIGPRGKGKAQVAVGIAEESDSNSNVFRRFASSFSKPQEENPSLYTFLTYVTLSWESIINDLLWK